MIKTSTWAAIAVASLMATTANAAAIVNGSFELGTNPGSFTTQTPGSTAITGWTVGGNSVDYIGTYWQAADGVRSVDLAGNGSGSISQTLSTNIGQTYTVGFDLSGNPDGGLGSKISVVSISGSLPDIKTYTVGATNSRSNMNWQRYTYTFTAFATSSALTFATVGNSPYGTAIDNVSIDNGGGGTGSNVPEPASWAMLITGFGLVGAAARRRKPRVITA